MGELLIVRDRLCCESEFQSCPKVMGKDLTKSALKLGSKYYGYKLLFSGICSLCCGVMMIAFAIWSQQKAKKDRATLSGSVVGRVTDDYLERDSFGSKKVKYSGGVQYSYSVGEVEYTGSQELPSNDRGTLRRQIEALKTSPTVYYDPAVPSVSKMILDQGSWLPAGIGVALIVMGGLLIVFRRNKYLKMAAFVGDVSSMVSRR